MNLTPIRCVEISWINHLQNASGMDFWQSNNDPNEKLQIFKKKEEESKCVVNPKFNKNFSKFGHTLPSCSSHWCDYIHPITCIFHLIANGKPKMENLKCLIGVTEHPTGAPTPTRKKN
jgi:hypothetical protein